MWGTLLFVLGIISCQCDAQFVHWVKAVPPDLCVTKYRLLHSVPPPPQLACLQGLPSSPSLGAKCFLPLSDLTFSVGLSGNKHSLRNFSVPDSAEVN